LATRFDVLGPITATVDGEAVSLGSPMQRALLAALLLRANQVVSRDHLVDALWDDDPPASAPGSLQIYVHGLRRALGRDRIATHGTGYLIRVEPGELDLDRFVRLVADARRALAEDRPSDAEEDLHTALALATGPPLAGLPLRGVLEVEVDRIGELRLEAIELQNDAQLASAEPEALCPRLESLVAEYPFRERFRAQLMLALYRSGRQKDALDAFQEARRVLVEELGVEPGPALQDLQRAILRQDPDLDSSVPHRRRPPVLPAAPTPLIGRELEVAAVTALLHRDDVRLVTLTGPGGSGKTRVALAAAEELTAELRDGAVFVDLSSVDDPSLLVPTVASAIGVDDRDASLEVALAEDLSRRSGLLVLDNFEQLLPVATWVADILRSSRRLLVLVTSRVPLRLSWEHEYPVPPLTPPDERSPDIAALAANDAVRLFVGRAQAVDPSFELSSHSAQAVAAVCRRLDGLPLAIELAAARTKVVPLDAMVRQLEQMLPLLMGGPVDAPERHRTLQATLDWSFELLTERERRLFERLAVFSGGCTVDTAVLFASEGDASETLATLVDHSLLRRVDRAGELPRFLMLETIREYARTRLVSSGEEELWRRCHAEVMTELAETTEPLLAGEGAPPIFRRLESEHDNFRASLAFLHERGENELELRLAASLALFWRVRAHLGEGRMWLEGALATEADVPRALRAKAASNAGRLAFRQGDYSRARTLHDEALALARALGDLRAVGQSLSDLGGVAIAQNDLDRAYALYSESAAMLREVGHEVRLGTVLANLAGLQLRRGDGQGARALIQEALALQERTGDTEGRVFTYLILARTTTHDGGVAEAAEALRQALLLIDELDYREMHGYWLLQCAELAATRGEQGCAARLLGAAHADFERLGITRLQADDREIIETIETAAVADLGRAGFLEALAEGSVGMTDEQALSEGTGADVIGTHPA
jgi:predicted ATPase/DNA-binding SARP family transcriptional activator